MSRAYQQRFVEHDLPAAWKAGHRRVILALPPGAGKCLGVDVKVLLWNGNVKRAEEVIVGDVLMGPDGPRNVLSTTISTGPMYRVKPVKGQSWTCNDVHVLTLVDTDTDEVFDIPLNTFLAKPKWFRERKKLFIPELTCFARKAPPLIDPYFLGIWFGDGEKALATVVVHKPDPEIRQTCEEIAAKWGLSVNTCAQNRTCPAHYIVGKKGNKFNPLLNALRELVGSLIRIPDCITKGAPEVRRAFLAGFADTDGFLHRGNIEIVQKRQDYAKAIAFIARSLGIRAHESIKIVNNTNYYRVLLSGELTQLPLRIPRKIPQARKQIKDAKRTGFSVEPIGEGAYAGFELDGNGRFLLEDFTVTHNTRATRLVIERLLSIGGWDAWFTAHRRELVEQSATELRHLNPSVLIANKDTPKPSPLRVASRDTLARRQIVPLYDRCFFVIDECHRGSCDTQLKILQILSTVYRIVYVLGLTATPYTLSGKPIPADVIVEPVRPVELFDAGIIMEPRVIRALSPDLKSVPVRGGDFVATEVELRSRKLVGDMVREAKRYWEGYPFIVRAISVADAEHSAERLRAAGFRVEVLTGETPHEQRDLILARLAIGGDLGSPLGLDAVVRAGNPDIIGEGWNNPSDMERVLRHRELWDGKSYPPPFVPVSMLSDRAPTMSECLYRQAECRTNRPNGDRIDSTVGPLEAVPKRFCRVISHSGNWSRFVPLRDHHSFALNEGAPSARVPRDSSGLVGCRYCPACLSVWSASLSTCSCGATLTEKRLAEEDSAIEMAEEPAAPTIKVVSEDGRMELLKNLYRKPRSDAQVRAIYHKMTGHRASSAELRAARAKAQGADD